MEQNHKSALRETDESRQRNLIIFRYKDREALIAVEEFPTSGETDKFRDLVQIKGL